MCEPVRSPSHRRVHPTRRSIAISLVASVRTSRFDFLFWSDEIFNKLVTRPRHHRRLPFFPSSSAIANPNLAANVINRQRSFTFYLLFAPQPLAASSSRPLFSQLRSSPLAVIFLTRAPSTCSTIILALFRETVKVRPTKFGGLPGSPPPRNARERSCFLF